NNNNNNNNDRGNHFMSKPATSLLDIARQSDEEEKSQLQTSATKPTLQLESQSNTSSTIAHTLMSEQTSALVTMPNNEESETKSQSEHKNKGAVDRFGTKETDGHWSKKRALAANFKHPGNHDHVPPLIRVGEHANSNSSSNSNNNNNNNNNGWASDQSNPNESGINEQKRDDKDKPHLDDSYSISTTATNDRNHPTEVRGRGGKDLQTF
ncbi:hypothetical protein RFI_39352, partial [Reticulomyxa filosa]